jgi:aspartyl-tRNA(Asn)/glutamyl-tRNA(Gln) amidotransferase subunit A
MYPPILQRFRGGATILAADYVAAWRRLAGLRRVWAARAAEADAVILPSVPNLPPEVARLLAEPDHFIAENLLALRNTRIANLMGLPAVTLPAGRPMCGVMLFGLPGGEERLLAVAGAVEAALR